MYTPDGLLPGAASFHSWLVATGKPFVFLSNTGAKNSRAVQKKFMRPPYRLADEPVPLTHIFTAAEAQVDFLLETAPRGSKILVIAGGEGNTWLDDLHRRGGDERPAVYHEVSRIWVIGCC